MTVDPRAGKLPEPSMLANIPRLVSAYYTMHPDPARREERVAFGTSGHRGTSLSGAFTESHILATTQAICHYRREQEIDGPVFLGIDTHDAPRGSPTASSSRRRTIRPRTAGSSTTARTVARRTRRLPAGSSSERTRSSPTDFAR
jgi:hypothetical protein